MLSFCQDDNFATLYPIRGDSLTQEVYADSCSQKSRAPWDKLDVEARSAMVTNAGSHWKRKPWKQDQDDSGLELGVG